MASKNDILTQATLEYEAAKRKGDKAGMVRAHAKADRARGAYTKTVLENGRYKQVQIGQMGADAASGKLLEQTRQLNAPVLPKAPKTNFQSVLDEYNTSLPGIGNQVANALPAARKQEIAQGTQRFFEQSPTQAGYMQGVSLNNPVKSLERKLGTSIDTTQAEQSGFYKAGEIGGIMTQFALPYAGASGTIGKLTAKALPTAGKLGQGIAKSVATDLAVGLPLNVNYAYNKEGLEGTDALKSIAANTGLDLVTGGILEAAPAVLKGLKTEKIPVLVDGKVKYVDAPVALPKANIPAPIPRTVAGVAKNAPVEEVIQPSKTYLHATNKEFDKFKPANDGLIYFSEKGNGKTKADYIYSGNHANRMIEANIDESKIKHFDPFVDPEAKAIAEKYGLPTDRSYVKWDEVAPMSQEAIKKGYNSFEILEPDGGYSRAISDPETISIKGETRKTPQTLPRASNSPVQPRNPEKGIEIPKEQEFAENGGLPKGKLQPKFKSLGADTNRINKTVYLTNDESYGKIPTKGVDAMAKPKVDTTGQQINPQHAEILKETKAKKNGKVTRVYHGTIYGDFGEFKNDPLGQEAKRYARELSDYENKTTETVKNAMPWESPTKLRQPEPPKPIKDSVFFFSDNKAVAETYTHGGAEDKKFVGEYYLNLKKPKIIDMKGRSFHDTATGLKMEELIAQAKKEGYDGIIEKNVLDGRTYGENEQLGTNYVVFSPEQIVRVDKSARAEQKFKDLGADTFSGEKTIDDLVNEYGALPKGEIPRAREVSVPRKTAYGDTQQYARTLQESAIVDDTLFKEINDAVAEGSFTKPTKANKTAVEDANVTIEEGLDAAKDKFRSVLTADKKPTSYDIALGNRVLQELQRQGRYDEAVDVAIDLSEMLSESGRTLQAARIAKRLSPEGRLQIAARVSAKISKKTGRKVNLSTKTIKLISEATSDKEISEANHQAAIELWNQVPANWVDKINSFRYMSMLFNPKTHVRNILGNSLFLPVREFKNLIGAGLEKAIIKDGAKTKAVLTPNDKDLLDFASKDFENVKPMLKNEGKLDQYVRPSEAKVYNWRWMEGIRKLNLNALDAEDTWFMKFAYDSSLAQYMKANKLTPENMVGDTLEKARTYAANEALKATYRDFNALANIISKGKANLASGKRGALGKVGNVVLEGAIPFTKTPMNIIKRGVAYSPANLVRGVANLSRVKTGKVTATEAIDQLASGLSGSALLGLGTFLGYNNIVKGKEGDYKDKAYNYNQMLGSQNYSLNIDGKSYTIDWAAPLSMPFFVGVEIANAVKDNNADLASVLDAMTQISDPMVNLSMLKGINDIMTNNFEGLGQTALDVGTGYLGQFNPTLFGQVARTVDDTRRSTISTSETGLGRSLDKFGRKQIGKLPMASKQLEPYVDLWGREQKSGNVVENFLSPGYFKSENVTPVDKELQKLIGKLDEETAKTVIPTSTAYQYDVESAGQKYRLTEKESTAYQKIRGQESYKGLQKLFLSVDYRSMSNEDKAKAVQDVYSAAAQKAKYEYFDNKGLPVTLALSKDYQEKYEPIKPYVSDKQFYTAVESMKGKSRDIEKAYAIEARLPKASDKIYSALGISQEAVDKARTLKQNGITAEQYQTAIKQANTNGNANVSKAEAVAYLDSQGYPQLKKYTLLKAMVPTLKDKNNPYL